MRQAEAGWELPWVTFECEHLDDRDLGIASARLTEKLGAPVLAIRYVSFDRHRVPESNRRVVEAVYVLEHLRTPGDARWNGRWIEHAALAELQLARPEHRTLIDGYFAEAEAGTAPPFRQPWAEPGWYGEATGWIEDRLRASGYRLVGRIEQIQGGSISCVLKCPTDHGNIFFKATADIPTFVDEPSIQTLLAGWYPDFVVAPIATNVARRWMLNVDYGESLWVSGNSLERRIELLERYARLQVASVERVNELLAAGCIDRRIDRLVEQIDPLLDDPLVIATLNPADYGRLDLARRTLKAMCQSLADYRVPHSLVHGDLHGGNVAIRDGRFLVFDWTDTCVAHPFLDPHMLCLDTSDEDRVLLRETYLAAWTGYEPIERLREAWALAEKLYGLHQAVSYQSMVNHVEEIVRGELVDGLPWALGIVVAGLD
jgi:hypothetical protein